MSISKENLNNFLPNGFETENKEDYKMPFDEDLVQTGYERDVPDIVSGPNLNNLIDVIGKNTNTLNSYVEYLNSLSVNKTPIVDSNNQLNSTQIGLKVYSATETYLLNDLVTTIQDEKVLFYKSLVASNTGNPLTNTDYWEEVKLGGGSLEVCDIGMALYVDETKGLRRYLNGQIVDINTNTQAFLNRLKEVTTLHPSLLCTEEEWQAAKAMSAFGQVGKFVFNYSGDNIVSVRLPRIVNVQGLFDLQNLGMTVEAGLPNITGSFSGCGKGYVGNGHTAVLQGNGAFSIGNQSGLGGSDGLGGVKFYWCDFNASRSNPIYGKSNTVQEEAIQYPYFIQIATGSETENNIVNEIELNNPYSLFDSKYSDHELNNLSWLKSEGQWNSKAVYPDAYDKLLKVYNGTETVEGLSVKLSTETYTDYDFVLNTSDETFRLPLLDGSEDLPTGEIISQTIPSTNTNTYYQIDYNCFVTIRLTGCTHCRLWDNTQNRETWTDTVDAGYQGKTLFMPKGHQLGVYYQNGTMTMFTFQKAKGNGSLYFYVGETVQNAKLIDAGRIGEILPTKTDMQQAAKASMPSNRYIDLTLGASGATYTAPADGYFVISKITTSENENVTFRNTGSNGTLTGWGKQVISRCTLGSTGGSVCTFCPAKKGDIVIVSYNAGGKLEGFGFVYAEGSKED